MTQFHNLLKRQLKRHLNKDQLDDLPLEWKSFIQAVNEAYIQSDTDREMLERSMEINSQELLQINAMIRERERRLTGLLDNVELVAIGLNRNGNVEYVNPFFLKLTGNTKEEVLGKFWGSHFFPKGQHVQTEKAFREMLEREFHSHDEKSIMTKSGEERLIVWNNTLLRDEEGIIIGTISIGEDITDKRRMLQQIIESEKMSTVAQLAAGVAHEVKNPLAIMLQGLQYFIRQRETGDDKIVASILKDMQSAVFRADSITKGLLDLSKPTQILLKPNAINTIIENTLLLLKNQLDRAHIRVVRQLNANLPDINLDKNKMIQLFINLFNNAQEAMPQGGVLTIRTALGVVDAGWQIVVTVEDTGIGIPMDVKSRIFDPFFTTKRGQGGTGLGLPIVKNIIQLHKGTIEINNRSGRGVEVRLLFPIE